VRETATATAALIADPETCNGYSTETLGELGGEFGRTPMVETTRHSARKARNGITKSAGFTMFMAGRRDPLPG